MPELGHNIFISWSGSLSKKLAHALRDWLPNVLRDAVPWMSSEDIAKGSVWSAELEGKLNTCKVAIVVLTRDNRDAPWVLFEAGALYKAMRDRFVCTLLCDLSPPLTGPLALFQATMLEKEDFRRLVATVNDAMPSAAPPDRISVWFERFWPDFQAAAMSAIHSNEAAVTASPLPSDREILDEILATTRAMRRAQQDVADGSFWSPTESTFGRVKLPTLELGGRQEARQAKTTIDFSSVFRQRIRSISDERIVMPRVREAIENLIFASQLKAGKSEIEVGSLDVVIHYDPIRPDYVVVVDVRPSAR